MLTQIADRALITSRAASSRGRIIATHASCRLSPSCAPMLSAYAKSLPVLYGGSM